MKWNVFIGVLLLVASCASLAGNWEAQCESAPKGDCLFERVLQYDGVVFQIGFGRASGSTLIVMRSQSSVEIIDVMLEKVAEDPLVTVRLEPVAMSSNSYVAKVAGNIFHIENAFSVGSNYVMSVQLSNGQTKKIPASLLDLKSATGKLGEQFYNKFNFPDEDYIKLANKHFQQAVGIALDEYIKISTVFMTRHVGEKSITLFYSYALREAFGDEAEAILNESMLSVMEPRMEQICTKQLPLLMTYDGVKELKVIVSLQGASKTLSTSTMACRYPN